MREFMRQLVLAMQRLRPRSSVTLRVSGTATLNTGRGTHNLTVGDALIVDLAPDKAIEIRVVSING